MHDSWRSNAWFLMIKCMILDDQMHDSWWSNAWYLMIKHHQALSSMLYDVLWCFMMLHDASWCFMMLHDASWCFTMLHDPCCNTLDVIMNDLRFWSLTHWLTHSLTNGQTMLVVKSLSRLKIPLLKSWFCGSIVCDIFGILKIGPLEP